MNRPIRRRHAAPAAAVLALLVVLGGCRDADADPMAVLVAAETHGALAVTESLPSLGDLIDDTPGTELSTARTRWSESWQRGRDGRYDRMDAYVDAAPALATRLGPAGIARVVEGVRRSVDAALLMDPTSLPDFVLTGIAEAQALTEESEQSLAGQDRGRALLLALEASDRLRELGPEEVARTLLVRAEQALGRNGEAASYSELEAERSRHLLSSAREAMDGGDYLRAIRRAFYACQLLDVGPS